MNAGQLALLLALAGTAVLAFTAGRAWQYHRGGATPTRHLVVTYQGTPELEVVVRPPRGPTDQAGHPRPLGASSPDLRPHRHRPRPTLTGRGDHIASHPHR